MNGSDEDGWSSIASEWAELWGGFADPVRRTIVEQAGIGAGSRVLDVGCGSGEFLALLAGLGAVPFGTDPSPGMLAQARSRVPTADIRPGLAENLPWPDRAFDAVVAVNALQFADDTLEAVTEAMRVVIPGGAVAIANWAEGDRNDLDTIEAAVAQAAGEEPEPDGDLRESGGLERLLGDAGLEIVFAGLVEARWEPPDDDSLVRGVLLGEDPTGIAAAAPTVLEAARPFRTADGSYRLVNAFRYCVGSRADRDR